VGCLQRKINYWETFATSEVANWIRNGYYSPVIAEIPTYLRRQPKNKIYEAEQMEWTNREIERLCSLGCLEAVAQGNLCPESIKAACYIRLAPKKGPKKYRLVVNQRPLKKFLGSKSVQYEDFSVITTLAQPGSFGSSLDLESGYHQVLVREDYSKFLGIFWNGIWYRFTVLPFGLSHSPYAFCTVMGQLVKHLRSLGIVITFYIDDFLILGKTYQECLKFRKEVEQVFEMAGARIEWTKGQREPSQRFEHMGLILNLAAGMLEIPEHKLAALKEMLHSLASNKQTSGRELARVAGKVISIARAFSPARLYVRELYTFLVQSRQEIGSEDWDQIFPISEEIMPQILWLSEALQLYNGKSYWKTSTMSTLHTDASLLGWGYHWGSKQGGGNWTEEQKKKHINELELLAVENSLITLCEELKGKSIQLAMDNTVALSYVKNFKGGKKMNLHEIAKRIWNLVATRDLMLSEVVWIPSEKNKADWESRFVENQGWRVKEWVFLKSQNTWGECQVDRFASHRNKKLPQFNSETWCPGTSGVNALAQDWRGVLNWAVPPTYLIWDSLRLLIEQEARAVMVIPIWPNKTWFCQMEKLKEDEFFLPNPENTFEGNQEDLPFQKGWRWKVVLLDGKRFRNSSD